jgi:hypothetical protein
MLAMLALGGSATGLRPLRSASTDRHLAMMAWVPSSRNEGVRETMDKGAKQLWKTRMRPCDLQPLYCCGTDEAPPFSRDLSADVVGDLEGRGP